MAEGEEPGAAYLGTILNEFHGVHAAGYARYCAPASITSNLLRLRST